MEQAGFEYGKPCNRIIRTPADAADACSEMVGLETESFAVLSVNAKHGMICSEIVTNGILDGTLIHPREVFRCAMRHNAKSIVVLHNHPSGDPSPSSEDIKITRQLVEAGRVVGIPVMDHVVVSKRGHKSLRECGVADFSRN